MAHNIEYRNGMYSFCHAVRAGVGKPWHGLGQSHEGLMTVEGAMNLARVADLRVHKHEFQFNGRGTGVYGIFREDTCDIIPKVAVGDRYTIAQYPDLIREFADAAYGENSSVVDTMGVLGEGERMFTMFLGETSEIKDGDPVQSYYALTSAHDGSATVQFFGTDIRIVCANTLRVALKGEKRDAITIRHTSNMDTRIKEVTAALEEAREVRNERIAAFRKMSDRQMGLAEFKSFLDEIHPINGDEKTKRTVNTRNRLMDLYGGAGRGSSLAGYTAWGAFQAVTQMADETARGDQKWTTSLFGTTQNQDRQRAFDYLLALSS